MPYKDKEKDRQYHNKYRRKYPERFAEGRKKWRVNNPDKVKAIMIKSQKEFKKRLIVLKLEKGGKCTMCGFDQEIKILHFHHLRDKSFSLSTQYCPMEKMRQEAEKCILLCPNCHALTHLAELKSKDKSLYD